MKADEAIQELKDTDIIIVPHGLKTAHICCCDCGLWHRIELTWKENGDVHVQAIRQEGVPEIDGYTELKVIRGE